MPNDGRECSGTSTRSNDRDWSESLGILAIQKDKKKAKLQNQKEKQSRVNLVKSSCVQKSYPLIQKTKEKQSKSEEVKPKANFGGSFFFVKTDGTSR